MHYVLAIKNGSADVYCHGKNQLLSWKVFAAKAYCFPLQYTSSNQIRMHVQKELIVKNVMKTSSKR